MWLHVTGELAGAADTGNGGVVIKQYRKDTDRFIAHILVQVLPKLLGLQENSLALDVKGATAHVRHGRGLVQRRQHTTLKLSGGV